MLTRETESVPVSANGNSNARNLLTVSCRPYGHSVTVFGDRVEIKRKGKTIPSSSLSAVKYWPGIPVLLCPVMTLEHEGEAGHDEKTRIAFHGVIPRLFTRFAGPGQCVELLRKLVAERNTKG